MSTPTEPISSCLVCDKPLGQESKDGDWRTCHEHRKCQVCGELLSRIEIHLAHASAQDEALADGNQDTPFKDLMLRFLAHARCQLGTDRRKTADQDPLVLVRQSYLDWLNAFRLFCQPQMELSQDTNEKQADLACIPLILNMTQDEKFMFLCRMESGAAHVGLACKADKKAIKERMDAYEAKKFKEAQKQALTSGRPNGKPVDDEKEVLIGQFMQRNGIKDRSVAFKLWKEREKSIQSMMSIGMDSKIAHEAVDKILREQGRIK
jgi:hypothetical protein